MATWEAPRIVIVSLEPVTESHTTDSFQIPDPGASVPDSFFDRQWALNVIDRTLTALAAEVAAALAVEKLFFVLKVPGLLSDPSDPSSLVPLADLGTLDTLAAAGAIRDGMRPKLAAARKALNAGVASVHLVSGVRHDAILAEVFTNEGSGTMLVSKLGEEGA